jgi:hypothetical protein
MLRRMGEQGSFVCGGTSDVKTESLWRTWGEGLHNPLDFFLKL